MFKCLLLGVNPLRNSKDSTMASQTETVVLFELFTLCIILNGNGVRKCMRKS